MKQLPFRLSTQHSLALCTPLVLLWVSAGCQGRLAVSDEPVPLPDTERQGPELVSSVVDAGVSEPVDVPDATSPVPSGSCTDGSKNGDETDIDCGGSCQPCAAEFSCARHDDCQSQLCRAGLCAATGCEDGIRNGNEVGVDCGGDCPRCLSSTCNCASSAGLSALSCDETRGVRSERGEIFVSDDGQTALYGECYDAPASCRTFRWTRSAGLQLVSADDSAPRALSADGHQMLYQRAGEQVYEDADAAVVLPFTSTPFLSRDGSQVLSIDTAVDGGRSLTRWTPAGGRVSLATLPTGPTFGEITGVTPDGAVITGILGDNAGETPFRWTALDGLQSLGTIGGSATGARPVAINGDGSVIVGYTSRLYNAVDLFRWTESGGMDILAAAYPLSPSTLRMFLNADGAQVAATVGGAGGGGVRWSFPGGANVMFPEGARVGDMSDDGAFVVGQNDDGAALFWDVVNGPRRLQDIAASKGIDTSGWQLEEPTFVAEDGSYVFGTGLCGETQVTYRLVLTE